jgi:phosphatidate cytidylyltransferase
MRGVRRDLSILSESPSAPVSRRWSDLRTRALSGFVLIATAIGAARAGGPVFVAFWLVASIAVLWEWQRLVGAPALAARVWIGGVALGFCAFLAHDYLLDAVGVLGLAAIIIGGLGGRGQRLWTGGGMLYAGLLILATISLRFSFPFGSRSIIWLFATVWATDIFAYFGGRLVGGPKLWPRVSPSKTWSGTMIGLAAGSLIGTFAAVRDLPTPKAIVPIFFVTLAASMFSQAGDAFESAVKRRFDIKDSSHLIPGHGGVMDRLDGFVAAAAFAMVLGLVRNLPSVAGGLFYWA